MNTTTVFNICYVLPIFEDVARSIHASLLELGFQSHLSQSTIIVEATNILFGAHLIQDQRNIPPNSIIFNLEQLDSNSRYCDEKYFNCLKTHTVWDYSQKNIDYLKSNRINPDAVLIHIGYSPALTRIAKPEVQDIDVLFYGALNERRQKVLDGLKAAGLNVVNLLGVFGPELDHYIGRSKTILNLHFHETKIFEIVRVSYLLNNHKVVISEVDYETDIDPFIRSVIIGVEYDKLIETTVRYVKDEELRKVAEESSRNAFSQRTQTELLKAVFESLDKKIQAPLFSVVIATHNRPVLLRRALQSIHDQSYPHIQTIVISDEHNNATYEAATQQLRAGDVFIERSGVAGPSESRNIGMAQIRGDYFLFLDDDDSFAPDFFQKLTEQLQNLARNFSPANVYYTNFETVNEAVVDNQITLLQTDARDIAEQDADRVYVKNFIPNNCLIYPKRLAQEIRFDSAIAYEDWDFILSACKKIPLQHLAINGPRIHKNNSADVAPRGKSNDPSLLECYLAIYTKHPSPNEHLTTLRKELFSSIGLNLDDLLIKAAD